MDARTERREELSSRGAALAELTRRAEQARAAGAGVAVVVGLGFVGTAVAAALSRARRAGAPRWLVIGLERDDPAGRSKVARLEEGVPPARASDPELAPALQGALFEARNLAASVDVDVLALADAVVTCLPLDLERPAGRVDELRCDLGPYAELLHAIGLRLRPGALVVVESTLPLGASERVLVPALHAGLRAAGRDPERDPPRYAYCYERVMPGPAMLASVDRYPRAYAGADERSALAALEFLASFVDVQRYPPWRHAGLRAAELAKLLENAWRATSIAFVDEWARLAEVAGVDLFDVVDSIRVRKGTHDNLAHPGLGVGGYCLTKDALLAAWGAEELLALEAPLEFSRLAILTNAAAPGRALERIRAHLREAGEPLAGARVALLGVTYRPGVADTRCSPSATLARALCAEGAQLVVHDPLVSSWPELPELRFEPELDEAVRGARAIVIAVPDPSYRERLPAALERCLERGALLVDPWNLVAERVRALVHERGAALFVYGRGDLADESA